MKKTPDESAEPQDSAEPASSSQESLLPATDASKDAPKLDPDAWIQVEKRHRQPSGKAKVENLNLRVLASYFHPFLPPFSFCVSPHFILLTSSILPCSPFLLFVSICVLHPSACSMSVMMCVLSAPLLPQRSDLNLNTSPLQLSTFLLSLAHHLFSICRSSNFSHPVFTLYPVFSNFPNQAH